MEFLVDGASERAIILIDVWVLSLRKNIISITRFCFIAYTIQCCLCKVNLMTSLHKLYQQWHLEELSHQNACKIKLPYEVDECFDVFCSKCKTVLCVASSSLHVLHVCPSQWCIDPFTLAYVTLGLHDLLSYELDVGFTEVISPLVSGYLFL